MAASGETIGAGHANVKLHPYLVTLVRWCVSCVWSTATVLLHRLLYTPLQPITGPKPAPARGKPPVRVPSTSHLHVQPRVECQLLHQPHTHTMDVIFVHGLYGSLGNTWRQGDWRQKYATDPKIVTLIDHSEQNTCKCHKNTANNDNTRETKYHSNNDTKYETSVETNVTDINDTELSINKINEKLSKKIIPKENDLITEQFYNNTLVDQNEEFHTQARFVSDMFKKETSCDKNYQSKFKLDDNNVYKPENRDKCKNYNDITINNNNGEEHNSDININSEENKEHNYKCRYELNECNYCKYEVEKKEYENSEQDQNRDNFQEKENAKCRYNEINELHKRKTEDNKNDSQTKTEEDFKNEEETYNFNEINDFNECKCKLEKNCEVGCGCICNDCYSTCWPRDWIREDFPGARIISINYTSDPYLWRPLWIKESKRSNLYERAEQMLEQLLELGVGETPIVWVGHSKGGLFIKQIYCQAYEAHLKTNQNVTTQDETKQTNNNKTSEDSKETNEMTAGNIDAIIGHFSHKQENNQDNITIRDNNLTRINNNMRTTNELTKIKTRNDLNSTNKNYTSNIQNVINNNSCVMNDIVEYENIFENLSANNGDFTKVASGNIENCDTENNKKEEEGRLQNADLENGNGKQDLTSNIEDALSRRARLWSLSRGFMFYSVPHRGSPLADIKTPLTARSVDLLEIAKDCPLVVELQARWVRAARGAAVRVRSAVETSRTLMSVLWLRIVSAASADAGFGTLSGVAVDHREICKPTSRSCRLYTMLTELIREAVDCTCTAE